MDRLDLIVKSALPTLKDEALANVVQRLIECGVEGQDDLMYIHETDLVGILKPVQCRKLLAVFAQLDIVETRDIDSQTTRATENRSSCKPILESKHDEEHISEEALSKLQISEKLSQKSRISESNESGQSGPEIFCSEPIVSSRETTNCQPFTDISETPKLRYNVKQDKPIDCVVQTTEDSKLASEDVRNYRRSVISVIFREAMPDVLDWSDTESLEGSDDGDDILEDVMTTETILLLPDSKSTPFMIAAKIMMSENMYVGQLEILYTNFFQELNKENLKSPFLEHDTLTHIFGNLENIYLFHKTFLLPQLEDRVKNWCQDRMLRDILSKNVPFLRIYIDYIQNYPQAINLVHALLMKSTRFIEVIDHIMKQPQTANTSLIDLLKEPVDRLNKYIFLIREYAGVLQKDSTEFSQVHNVLSIASKIAHSSSECMKKQESFLALYILSKKLTGVPQDFLTPTRELIAEGHVTEVSERGREKVLRHLMLFNDLILVCSHDNTTDKYAVWAYIEMDGIEMKLLDNTFELTNDVVRCELLDSDSSGAPNGWIWKIDSAIKDYEAKKNQRLSYCSSTVNVRAQDLIERPASYFGKVRPIWVPDYVATKCMVCREKFNVVNRRHHCRSCGKLICRSCCKKAPIEYKNSKKRLVCAGCFLVIMNKSQEDNTEAERPSVPAKGKHSQRSSQKTSHVSVKISSFLHSPLRRITDSSAEVKTGSIKITPPSAEPAIECHEPSDVTGEKNNLQHQSILDSEVMADAESPYQNITMPSALSILESANDSTILPLTPNANNKNKSLALQKKIKTHFNCKFRSFNVYESIKIKLKIYFYFTI
ncbi:hypothetical protein Btru_024882 [Bulinus truncatus]|nr:hypothetical protein Btru_024882 [Bulinus truncatus]